MKMSAAFTTTLLLVLVSVAYASETCAPGYFITNSGICKKCPKGSYQPQPDQNGCKPCHDGDIAADEGSTECTPCGTNEEPNRLRSKCVCVEGAARKRRNAECVLCAPGTIFSGGSRNGFCFDCNAGYFQPEAGQTECLPCPSGSFSKSGAKKCKSCPAGEVLIKKKCGKCPAGKYYDTYSLSCLKCNPGTFKATVGQGPCLPCPNGGSSGSGATECGGCPDGEVVIGKKKNAKCGKCPAGSYYDKYSKRCRKCNENEFQPSENVRTSCFSCAGDTFSRKGATECSRCGPNEGLMKDGTCGSCEPGFAYERFALKCNKCGFNDFSSGRIDDYCRICPTRSFSLPGSSTCFACPDGEALIRKTRKCGMCPAGKYYVSFDGSCEKCYEGSIRSEPNIKDTCQDCPRGTTSNKKRTKCIPK